MITLINNHSNESKNINGTYKSEDGRIYFRDYKRVGRAPGQVYLSNNHLVLTDEVDEADGRYYVTPEDGWSLAEKKTGSPAPAARQGGTLLADLRANAKTLLRYVTDIERVKRVCADLQFTGDMTDEQLLSALSLEQLRALVTDNTPEQYKALVATANRATLLNLAQSSISYLSKYSIWDDADLQTAKNRLAALIEAEGDIKRLCDVNNDLSNAIYYQAEADEAQAQAQADEAQAQAKPKASKKASKKTFKK